MSLFGDPGDGDGGGGGFDERIAIRLKKEGKAPRVGPDRYPEVPYPEPVFVAPPWEGGDGKEAPRHAASAVV